MSAQQQKNLSPKNLSEVAQVDQQSVQPFPRSQKVYVQGTGEVRVPMREVALSGGEPPLLVPDTSGPRGHDAGR